MMNERDHELLSALMDGELDRFTAKRVIDQTLRDPEAIRRWKHYHLISDTLQHGLHGASGDELRDRVRLAIDNQPAAGGGALGWMKPAAGFALAASVAVVAVLGVQGLNQDDRGSGERLAANSASSNTASVHPTELLTVADRAEAERLAETQMQRYAVEHFRMTGGGINGALPSARIVSYSSGH